MIDGRDELNSLPPRLCRIVDPLASGLTNARIADSLNYQLHTVENYVAELKQRFNAEDRVQLVLILREIRAN